MGIDCLALMLTASPNKQKTENFIIKELGIQPDARGAKKTREDILFEEILARVSQNALPFISSEDLVEFKPQQPQQTAPTPSTNFMQYKQNSVVKQEEVAQLDMTEQAVPKPGPSSNMKTADPALKNQLMQQNTIKTPSMVFMENKRKIEEDPSSQPPGQKKLTNLGNQQMSF